MAKMLLAESSSKGGPPTRRSSAGSSCSVPSSRTYVQHDYEDHYEDPYFCPGMDDQGLEEGSKRRGPRGGVVIPFPDRLYTMLSEAEEKNFEHIVSWMPHGRCFVVHEPKKFVEEVLPIYFRQSKLTSFQRQVNLYGFRRLTAGTDRGGYYHQYFLRGRPDLFKKLVRIRVKGTGFKAASSPATEPDFYKYPPCAEIGPSHVKEQDATEGANASNPKESLDETSVVTPPFGLLMSSSAPSLKDAKPLAVPTTETQSLFSMAHHVKPDALLEKPTRGIVTPESKDARHVISSGLQDALVSAMSISPENSPIHSSLQSIGSLTDDEELDDELLLPPLSEADELFTKSCCQSDGFDRAAGLRDESSGIPANFDTQCDPLLLLDEVLDDGYYVY